MKKLIGKSTDVFLKIDDEVVSGVLFDIDDDCVYLQRAAGVVITVPKSNIKYVASKNFEKNAASEGIMPKEEGLFGPDNDTFGLLEVFVDSMSVVKLIAPPSLDLSTYSDDIMRLVLSSSEVASSLSGKVQKSLEYAPGQVFITTSENSSVAESIQAPPSDGFSMTGNGAGSDVMSSYLQPSQMVSRLNKVSRSKFKSGEDDE
jgi:hypothetical protein